MSKYVVLIEIGKKQNFIFKSNVMAESIGASIIIKNATERDAAPFYKEYNPDIIYEGGGNALYVFAGKEHANDFARKYSKFLYGQYPGITLYLVGYELKDGESVKNGISACYRLLAEKKNARQNVETRIDFGRTVRCASTNMPANVWDRDGDSPLLKMPKERAQKKYSLEVMTKYKVCQQEQSEVFGFLLPEQTKYQFPKQGDNLGRSLGEKSYVAVTHIDGNQMGEKIRLFNENHIQGEKESLEDFDTRYIKALGDFSTQIRHLYEESVKETVRILIDNIENKGKDGKTLREKLDLKENDLPFRPLILAGDDICFISDGRIGIELCRICIEKIKEKEILGQKLNACGGVAMVKAHYPFSRAYDLAEELCQNAKDEIKEGDRDASYIDWHIDQAELDEKLSDIRRDYIAADGSRLSLRPLIVGEESKHNSMCNFVDTFQVLGNSPEIGRGAIKGMRDALRKGETATEYYLHSKKDKAGIINKLGSSNNLVSKNENGFIEYNGEKHSIFYDAIELMDVYIKLEE